MVALVLLCISPRLDYIKCRNMPVEWEKVANAISRSKRSAGRSNKKHSFVVRLEVTLTIPLPGDTLEGAI